MSWVTTMIVVPSSVQLAQERQQLVGAGAILPERGFVECEHGSAGHQRGADRQPTLLPAGEEERVGPGPVR